MGRKRTRSISVLLTDDEFRRLESFCEDRGHKKSTLVARLIREHLDAEHHQMQAPIFFSEPNGGS